MFSDASNVVGLYVILKYLTCDVVLTFDCRLYKHSYVQAWSCMITCMYEHGYVLCHKSHKMAYNLFYLYLSDKKKKIYLIHK